MKKLKSTRTCLRNLQVNSKITKNNPPPERIRNLLKNEKDYLSQLPIDILPEISPNTNQLFTSLDLPSTNDARLSLHHIINKYSSPDLEGVGIGVSV
ncbi:unnamed protein product [Rotaria socialis]|uniref:Uncharacterized protein n=1 Tax=Rotaria socialis TaxID=392032 RepID=A0A820PJJ0_9BILA|nr:unnamed protein product [Rotaria socialis]CAF3314746.1 unnamed protein product [Rotaria socialis]CAF3323780.1 unnamed protein product [Rotaria socialis]CAF3324408.1 unnamed protein product [Rotaria socialis]CAF3523289.1 unnamed protein product [Rotaria socialis]